MNKNLLGIIITAVAVAAVAGIVVANKNDNPPQAITNTAPATNQTDKQMDADSDATVNEQKTTSDVLSGTVAVDIKDFNFAKKSIKVKKGTKVVWTNQDSTKHDVMPDSESAAFKGSELLAKGESYEFTFDSVGTYSYHCSPHPYMKASVEVVE